MHAMNQMYHPNSNTKMGQYSLKGGFCMQQLFTGARALLTMILLTIRKCMFIVNLEGRCGKKKRRGGVGLVGWFLNILVNY